MKVRVGLADESAKWALADLELDASLRPNPRLKRMLDLGHLSYQVRSFNQFSGRVAAEGSLSQILHTSRHLIQ